MVHIGKPPPGLLPPVPPPPPPAKYFFPAMTAAELIEKMQVAVHSGIDLPQPAELPPLDPPQKIREVKMTNDETPLLFTHLRQAWTAACHVLSRSLWDGSWHWYHTILLIVFARCFGTPLDYYFDEAGRAFAAYWLHVVRPFFLGY